MLKYFWSREQTNVYPPPPRHQIFVVDAQEGRLTEMVLLSTQNRKALKRELKQW